MKIIRFLDREGKLGNRMEKIDFQAETLRWVMIMQNTANEMKKKIHFILPHQITVRNSICHS